MESPQKHFRRAEANLKQNAVFPTLDQPKKEGKAYTVIPGLEEASADGETTTI
jgi:hypothetical protein